MRPEFFWGCLIHKIFSVYYTWRANRSGNDSILEE